MGRYILRRLLAFIPTLLAISLLVFFMLHLIPGDPARMILGVEASDESVEGLRSQLGLDRPLAEQLVGWFARALGGDLGRSFFLDQPVTQAVAERLPVTFSLAAMALAIAVALGLSAGIIAAVDHGRAGDWVAMVLALAGLSLPNFWLGLNLILLFAVIWPLFPPGGFVHFSEDLPSFFMHLFLPAVALGLHAAGLIARMTRASMLEVLRSDYVRTARAKGLAERVVTSRHALRNALIPIITVVGVSAGRLLGGAVVIETVFNLPGVGRLVVEGVLRRDYQIVQGSLLMITASYLLVNLMVDLLYAWANPRIRYE